MSGVRRHLWGCGPLGALPSLNSSGGRGGGLLHGDPELHSVLGLGHAGPHQLDEEVGAEDPELGVAQLVQRVPTRGERGRVKRSEHEAPRTPQQGPQVTTPMGPGSQGGSHPQATPSAHPAWAASSQSPGQCGLLTPKVSLWKGPVNDS